MWLTGSAVTLAVTGAACSGLLLVHHDGGWNLGSDASPEYLLTLCGPEALPSASCADVVGSRLGSFDFYVGGRRFLVPLSFVGFSYFVTVAIWLTFTGLPMPSRRWHARATVAVVVAGVAVSVALSAVMAFSLHHWCPLCVASHIANIAMLACVVVGSRRLRPATSQATSFAAGTCPAAVERRLAVLGFATSVAAVVGAWLLYEANVEMHRYWRGAHGLKQVIVAMQNDAGMTLREFFAQPQQAVPVKEVALDDHRPTVTVFRSFASDASACFERDWREDFAAAVGDSLRIEYRTVPLEVVEARRRGEPLADDKTMAARAIEAARLQGDPAAYDELVTLLFRQRKFGGVLDVGAVARRTGLDAARLERDMEGDEVREFVEADIALAAELGIDHTPAVFIEGRRVPGLCLKSTVFWRTIGNAPGLTESVADTGRISSSAPDSMPAYHNGDSP